MTQQDPAVNPEPTRILDQPRTQHQPAIEPGPAQILDPLILCALECQKANDAWASSQNELEKQAHGALYRELLEKLWEHLQADLRHVARGWIYSNMAPNIEALALNLFANIVFQLPKLNIDPSLNVRNLLLTVARRGQIDEYRRTYAAARRRQPSGAGDQPAPAAQVTSFDGLPELIDPQSADIESDLIGQIDEAAILRAIWNYWPQSLNDNDYLIMKLRWQTDPQWSFREIAEHLGPGWEEATVRQRHHRILGSTRKYLRQQGLIDDTPAE